MIERETRDQLKHGFDGAAAAYVTSRPGYPEDAVDWLMGGRTERLLDLAAGSGALTRSLAWRAGAVMAAEPSPNLARELARAAPGVPVVQANAEHLPFFDSAFSVVTVATAFHWFDAELALPEIHRVLQPGGVLSLAWNSRVHETGWTKLFDDILKSAQPPGLRGDWGTGSVRALYNSSLFGEVEQAEFRHEQRLDRSGLRALAASRSYVIAMDQDRRSALFERLDALVDKYADESGHLLLPYRCECWRACSMNG